MSSINNGSQEVYGKIVSCADEISKVFISYGDTIRKEIESETRQEAKQAYLKECERFRHPWTIFEGMSDLGGKNKQDKIDSYNRLTRYQNSYRWLIRHKKEASFSEFSQICNRNGITSPGEQTVMYSAALFDIVGLNKVIDINQELGDY